MWLSIDGVVSCMGHRFTWLRRHTFPGRWILVLCGQSKSIFCVLGTSPCPTRINRLHLVYSQTMTCTHPKSKSQIGHDRNSKLCWGWDLAACLGHFERDLASSLILEIPRSGPSIYSQYSPLSKFSAKVLTLNQITRHWKAQICDVFVQAIITTLRKAAHLLHQSNVGMPREIHRSLESLSQP